MQNLANHLTQQQIDGIIAGHLTQCQISDILDQLRDNEPDLSEADLSAIAEELVDKYNRRNLEAKNPREPENDDGVKYYLKQITP